MVRARWPEQVVGGGLRRTMPEERGMRGVRARWPEQVV